MSQKRRKKNSCNKGLTEQIKFVNFCSKSSLVMEGNLRRQLFWWESRYFIYSCVNIFFLTRFVNFFHLMEINEHHCNSLVREWSDSVSSISWTCIYIYPDAWCWQSLVNYYLITMRMITGIISKVLAELYFWKNWSASDRRLYFRMILDYLGFINEKDLEI